MTGRAAFYREFAMIEPFPSCEDRRDFALKLTGLTDGEGCFRLCYYSSHSNGDRGPKRATPAALFDLKLRADDGDYLKKVQSFWAVGTLYFQRSAKPRQQPTVRFT